MTEQDFLELLKQTGGYITQSHIIATSGKHLDSYLNKDAIYPHTHALSAVCKAMATLFADRTIEVVVGPSLGGILLSQGIAYHLSEMTGRDVLALYTEKTVTKDQIFTRGYDALVRGKRVLVVEDILTTGGSLTKVVRTVKDAGGEVIAACAMVNRDPDRINEDIIGAPLHCLASLRLPSWDKADCPMCKANQPVNTTVGKGRDYLAQREAGTT
ncbi:MAG: phosphoribosyltransferase [Proteobacteria bacterium]|jgi:orotate phosphoribosyltransferase|nr:phosphoribosyltransferase family protein [Alphaproteobacteria bacterium]NCC04534.1 phosphoribosyltransferase [Pseudomonadota bacterium]